MAGDAPAPFAGASVLALRDFLGERLVPLLQRPFPELLLITDNRLSFEDSVSDAAVRSLLQAVLEEDHEDLHQLSIDFGRHLFQFLTEEACFQQAIRCVSSSFTGFAKSLNRALDYMYQTLGGHKSALPEALVQEVTSDSFLLAGITPAVPTAAGDLFLGAYMGMLDIAAAQLFDVEVRFSEVAVTTLATGRVRKSCRVFFSPLYPTVVAPGALAEPAPEDSSLDWQRFRGPLMGLDADTFERMHPFHFAMDLDMRVLQAGEALTRVLPGLRPGAAIQEVLAFRSPRVLWNAECLEGILQNDMLVKVVLSSSSGPDLCGGLHRVRRMRQEIDGPHGETVLLFIGTPVLKTLADMQAHKLFVSDFPPHDTSAEQMLVASAQQARAAKALKAAQQSNFELRETLAETLALQAQGLGQPALNVDSAGRTLLQLLDSFLMGNQVDAQQVITARTALLRAGVNMWRPLQVHWSEAVGADREVNKALAALLGAPHASESGDDDKASRSDDADEALLQQLENSSRGNSQAATTFRGTPGGTTGVTALMMESQPLPNVLSGSSGIGRFRPSYEPGRASSAIRGFTSYRMAPPSAPLAQQGREQAVQGPAGSQGQGQGVAGAAESQGSEGSRAAMVASQDVKVQVQTAPQTDTDTASGDTQEQEPELGLLCNSMFKIILHKLTCKHSPAPKRKPSGRGDKPASVRPEAYKTTDNAAACEQPDASTDPAAALAKAPPCSELLDTVMTGATVSGGDKLMALAPASESQLPCPLPVHMQQRHLASHPSSKRVRKMSIDNTPPLVKLLHEQPSDEMTSLLAGVDEWQYDSFALDAATGGRPLSCLAFHLFERQGLIKTLKLDATKLARFLTTIEEGYGAGQYHCRIHACDVLRTLHVILHRGGVLSAIAKHAAAVSGAQSLPDVGEEADVDSAAALMTYYLAAIVHDFEHRGVNNDFLIRSSDPLALTYNDNSPLENHHVAAAFTLMHNERFAFMPKIGKKMRVDIRRSVIDLVLATDMKQHFALTGSFSSKFEASRVLELSMSDTNTPCMRSATTLSANSGGPADDLKNVNVTRTFSPVRLSSHALKAAELWDHETEMLAIKMALKSADLGHLTSSLEVHKKWVARLEEELFQQGDRERALGQPISPLMDRTKSGIQKSQTGFFAVVAQPMYTSFTQAFPHSAQLLSNLKENLAWWKQVEAGLHK